MLCLVTEKSNVRKWEKYWDLVFCVSCFIMYLFFFCFLFFLLLFVPFLTRVERFWITFLFCVFFLMFVWKSHTVSLWFTKKCERKENCEFGSWVSLFFFKKNTFYVFFILCTLMIHLSIRGLILLLVRSFSVEFKSWDFYSAVYGVLQFNSSYLGEDLG